jgi:hypothetical protein
MLSISVENIKRQLSNNRKGKHSKNAKPVELVLRFSRLKTIHQAKSTTEPDEGAIKEANDAMEKMHSPGRVTEAAGSTLNESDKAVEAVSAIGALWAPLFEKVGVFMKIADALADVREQRFFVRQSVSSAYDLRFILMRKLHGQCFLSHSRFAYMPLSIF